MPLVHFGLEDKVLESSDVNTAQKLKFSIKDFFSKCDQIRRKLQIWSHLLKKSLWKTSFFVKWHFFASGGDSNIIYGASVYKKQHIFLCPDC